MFGGSEGGGLHMTRNNSQVNRPTSSLISKKAGLPQVFLEKYKKTNNHGVFSYQD